MPGIISFRKFPFKNNPSLNGGSDGAVFLIALFEEKSGGLTVVPPKKSNGILARLSRFGMGSEPEENPLPKGSGSTVDGSFSGLANPNAGPLLT